MLTHHNREVSLPSRVVILGARGFVGQALLQSLEKAKVAVYAIGSNDIDLAAEDAADRLAAELKPGDTIIMLSAITPDKGRGIPYFLANLRMAAALCIALEKCPVAHVIYVSSDAVYPFRTGLLNEETPAEPVDLYGAMHLSREIMVKQATKAPVAILRATLVYGAADSHNSYGPNRLRRVARKEGRITLFGGGEETRDHIYIDDVAALIEQVVRYRSSGTLNLASGSSISYADLAAKIADLFPSKIEIVATPRQNPITHRAFDITAVYRAFPAFRFTPLDQGLALSHRNEA
jgi:nucleoside-diphosphate-sugar epimerase